jgi:hypothetical protein
VEFFIGRGALQLQLSLPRAPDGFWRCSILHKFTWESDDISEAEESWPCHRYQETRKTP